MKAVFTLLFLTLFISVSIANSDMNYDPKAVDQTFSKLNQLEEMHHQNPKASFSELAAHEQFEGVQIEAATLSTVANAGDLPILPAFWWGCILGAIGVLLVYLITESKDQAMKALYGCLAWVVFWALWYIFAVVVWGGAFLWW